eukprot:1464035-Amphidinium_carterae.1
MPVCNILSTSQCSADVDTRCSLRSSIECLCHECYRYEPHTLLNVRHKGEEARMLVDSCYVQPGWGFKPPMPRGLTAPHALAKVAKGVAMQLLRVWHRIVKPGTQETPTISTTKADPKSDKAEKTQEKKCCVPIPFRKQQTFSNK